MEYAAWVGEFEGKIISFVINWALCSWDCEGFKIVSGDLDKGTIMQAGRSLLLICCRLSVDDAGKADGVGHVGKRKVVGLSFSFLFCLCLGIGMKGAAAYLEGVK